jgi:transketolase
MKTHIIQNFFDKPEYTATRAGFGDGLVFAGQSDSRVVALCSDLTESTKMDQFAAMFPDRFIEIGVAEQNMVTVASGMSAMGKTPFCASYAAFSPGRNWEQIRTTIAYNDRKVIVVGAHAGISVGPDGGTHQMLEDIALMRVLPNMTVVVPADAPEAKKATIALASDAQTTPAYLRLTREKTQQLTDETTPFEIGRAYQICQFEGREVFAKDALQKIFIEDDNALTVYNGLRIAIIGCGPVLVEGVYAAKVLSEKGCIVSVWNFHTIKPLDTNSIDDIVSASDIIVTLEEHQRVGGLGSAIAEYIVQNHHSLPVCILGIDDRYGQSGNMNELYAEYGIDRLSIVRTVSLFIERLKGNK